MGVEPNGALLAFTAFSFAGAALGGTFLMLLGYERYRLLVSLRNGEDLSARKLKLRRKLSRGSECRARRHAVRGPHAETELQLLCSIISMEHADLPSAEAELMGARDQPAARALAARLAILRGTFGSHVVPTAAEQLGKLGELIDLDTAAQMELASQRVPASINALMPTTKARVLAAQQKSDECLAILRALAPSRVDAMCTLFPEDPATRLWLRRSAGPYR